MSKFPGPNTVGHNDIITIVDRFCDLRESLRCIMPGYEFEHLVLGDYNFDDSCVRFCIQAADGEWLQDKLKDAPQGTTDKDAPKDEIWRRWAYDEIVQYRKDALELLEWLLTVPEDNRVEWIED